ncbi:MAG: ABC transporter permease [Cyclobacteriaceae bacterium]|nr:ABC transporter permease [Cyclobacteriaceae bacterium]
MLVNYLTIAWRILMRQKIYSTINVLGLTTGITASLLILVYVADELSYDRFLEGSERIYRVNFNGKLQDTDLNTVEVGLPMAEALQKEVSGIEAVTRVDKWMTCPVRYEDRAFTEMNFLLADSNFFSFFGYKLLVGNPTDALRGAGKIVISETAARRYFDYQGPGELSPLGKLLVIGSEGAILAEVTGIAEDPPHNTHLHYDFLMSLPTSGYSNNPVWLNFEVYTYVKLLAGTPVANVQSTMDGFITKYCAREIQQFLNVSLDQFLQTGGRLSFAVQPLHDIHLTSHYPDELEPNGNIEYVYLFGAIALFIVVLACINFMNLSTARSANRAKEIGVRKTVGAMRSRLMGQFFTESFLYCVIAVALAFGLVHVLLTPFNLLSGKNLTVDMLYQPVLLAGYLGLALFVGLLSGSYPALYLTSFQPVDVLKGRLRAGSRNSRVRNGLVIFQFCVSIALIISSMMVYLQLTYLQQQDVGFRKENVVGLMHTMNLGNQAEAFKQEVLKYPEFVAASYSSRLPPNVDWGSTFRTESGEENYPMSVITVDHDHLKTLGLTMVQGRFFSPDFISDTTAVVINETAARQFGFGEPVGSRIRYTGNDNFKMTVIGVVKDFNFETLKSTIRPMVMFLQTGANWDIAVRLAEGNPAPKIEKLGEIWKQFAPNSPYEYSFIDQNFDLKFRAEERLGYVILTFTALAIFIACLGLLGLATFTAEQRSKEISIRKVFGATLTSIVILLSKDFVRLIVLAMVIAVPITWYGITRWLEGFAYRISFSFPLVIGAGVVAILVALFTVSYQAIKAALENPVKSLKSE